MEINEIKKIIESLLFVSDRPLLNREIKAVIKDELSENDKIENILQEMQQEYIQLNRAYELKFVADGWTFATKPEYSIWIKKLLKEKTILKLSASAMEVLAIVAYKQPITRAEIDNIRGVDSGGVIDTLLDRKFIKIVGRKESLGRPLLYGTTQEFLRHFGLSHLSELPIIENINDVLKRDEELVQELPFEKDDNLIDSNEDEKKESISETIIEQDKKDFEDVLQIKDASTYENE
ncbi:MAG: SMC-Scp complex subunit ScpB [Endomicrobiia bacterium]|nr:SMC-Scp complex subunit ScpB [Endomicrobiaceae bacterium]